MSSSDSFSWGSDSLTRSGPEGRRRRRCVKPSTATRSLLALRAEAVIIDGFVLLVPVLGCVSALSLSYFFVYETLRGQTIGKRRRGLRVRAAGGGPARPNAVSARTVLRLIDGLAIYLVGALVALVSGSRRRRIGDWLGGTIVVRDDGELEDPPRPALWHVLVYPATWVAAVLVAVFALGVGDAVGSEEQAVSLVQSYARARQLGNATLACAMLSTEQQQELVAIQSGDYAGAQASRCPQYVLREDANSHLLNPELPQLLEGPVSVQHSTLGAVLVRSRELPQVALIVVKEGDRSKLDVRGLQRLEFIRACDSAGLLSSSQCGCTFKALREDGLLDRRYGADVAEAILRDRRACLRSS